MSRGREPAAPEDFTVPIDEPPRIITAAKPSSDGGCGCVEELAPLLKLGLRPQFLDDAVS
jgi:hypothetical protein